MDPAAQIRYQIYVTMVWISYYLAITTSPGTPPAHYKAPNNTWKRWCKKCENFKPERTHHCKMCNTCVLQMDHHCPWTNNCVGHSNMPHFLRFLAWVMFTTALTFRELLDRAMEYYHDRALPAYLIRKSEMSAVIVFGVLDAMVFLAVLLLFIRCVVHITSGKTQIEVWDTERIDAQFHTERFWAHIRNNYNLIHGKEMPTLTLWNQTARQYEEMQEFEEEQQQYQESIDDESFEETVPVNFLPDDVIFPYDMGFFANIHNSVGHPLTWLFPWGRPLGNGYEFPKNDDDDQLNLPWPPDGGNVDFTPRELTDDQLRDLRSVSLIKKHLDPRNNMKRSQWVNDTGETLTDYGVDVEGEDEAELEVEKTC